ncbi:MAG: hypothetical protein EHM40_02720 [Chloroflexi bacterium]|nr:MAG: hypothetical protein EHM40_02720 [Chloroflexota bacterium]
MSDRNFELRINLTEDEVSVLAKSSHGNSSVAQFVESMIRGFIAAQQSVQQISGTDMSIIGAEEWEDASVEDDEL